MNAKSIAMGVVVMVVATVLVVTCAIPIVNEGVSETKTFVNEGVPFAEPDSGTHTIVMDSTGMKTDGESITGLQMLYGNSVSILYCDGNVVRWATDGKVQVIGNTNQSGQRRIVGDTDTDTITISINGTVVSITNSNEEGTTILGSNLLAYPTADQNAKYRQGTQHYYTDDTNLIIAGGFSNDPVGGQVALVMTGTVEQITADFVWYYSVPATVDNIDVQTSNVTTNLHQIDKILVTMDVTATDETYNLTYTQFLSESTGIYDNPNYTGSTISTILAVIPVLMVIGIVIGAVALFVTTRRD